MTTNIDQALYFNWENYISKRENLDLSQLGLMDDAVVKLGEQLKDNQTVTFLNLSGNRITDAGVKVLAEQLKDNPTVRSLDLSGNEITNECTKIFYDRYISL